ncbi:hypothetical protein BDZ89DRAFT_1164027 [Hymenopellis radicata]|nr:hypothetical protein BDZ89DRAFT_1164027 [Hymenopellis radicata]
MSPAMHADQLLPPELWAEIFQYCTAERPNPTAIFISHVCQYWREIILHVHLIWSTVVMNIDRHDLAVLLDMNRTWASRSGSLPLRLELRVKQNTFTELEVTGGHCIAFVRTIADRCRSLYIEFPHPSCIQLVILELGCPFPVLQDVQLVCEPHDGVSSFCRIPFQCPRIRKMITSIVPGWQNPALSGLTTLHLKWTLIHRRLLFKVLETCTLLEDLKLDGRVGHDDPIECYHVLLPHLRTFQTSDISSIIYLALPNLSLFELTRPNILETAHRGFAVALCFRALFKTSNNPPLRHLILHDVSVDDMTLPLLGAASELEGITFISCTVDSSSRDHLPVRDSTDATCLFPKLSALRFVESDDLVSFMSCVIYARKNCSSSPPLLLEVEKQAS